MEANKRKRGRPPLEYPPRIDATPEEIAEAALRVPVPRRWKYLENGKRAKKNDEGADP